MPIAPLRDVGAVGLVKDKLPHDLPLSAWSDARNVRFKDGTVSRYSVFKFYDSAYTLSKTPVGVFNGGMGFDDSYVVTVFSDGSMEQNQNGTVTDVTPTGTLGSDFSQITTAQLGGVTYMNRPADIPTFRYRPNSGGFAPLTGWTATDRCASLRSFKDFLIAMDVTKDGTEYPQMVKWSNAAQAGVPPADWDNADDASLAGENVLNDCQGRLLDGLGLAESFIIYSETETFRMDFIGLPFIFRTQKVFSDAGAIAKNCAVNVEGKHFVFGDNDIYVHDGLSKMSVSDDAVRETVYSEIDMESKNRCFAYHDIAHSEIAFCYPTIDDTSPWNREQVTGCTRAAVFNYRDNTWTFIDLPSVIGTTSVSQVSGLSWEDFDNWSDEASKWNSGDGAKPKNLLAVSSGNADLAVPATLYFIDDLSVGRLENPVATDVLWPAYAERTHIDLDEMGVELYGRKQVNSITPQIRTGDPDDYVRIRVGYCVGVNPDVVWGRSMFFYPWQDVRYDCRVNHRYLAIRFDIPVGTFAELSGYDADIMQVSGR